MGCFLDDPRAFGINADQWTTAAQDEGGWRKTAEQGAEHFMAKWIALEKAKAGLRHAMVVCPNVTRRTKERIAQSSSRRGEMAQNGRTRGGTFHGEMDRCRENQGWTTACLQWYARTNVTREGPRRGCPKASGLVLVRSPLLTSHKWRELVSSGRLVCRCHGVFSLVLRLFCLASFFVSMLSLKPRPFVQSSFDMQAFR